MSYELLPVTLSSSLQCDKQVSHYVQVIVTKAGALVYEMVA